MPDEHKTLEQRITDIELNLKKLREEIIGAYISLEGKIVLEQSPAPTPEQPKANTGPTEEKTVMYQTGRRMKSIHDDINNCVFYVMEQSFLSVLLPPRH